MEFNKARYATNSTARTLADAVKDADIFLGCSAGRLLTQDMVETMGLRPLILALANPEPEILPELAKAVRSDCLIATGRSDYPNQVNNVLCFPFLFRGALDVDAMRITDEMKLACVKALADLAQKEIPPEVAKAYEPQAGVRPRLFHSRRRSTRASSNAWRRLLQPLRRAMAWRHGRSRIWRSIGKRCASWSSAHKAF